MHVYIIIDKVLSSITYIMPTKNSKHHRNPPCLLWKLKCWCMFIAMTSIIFYALLLFYISSSASTSVTDQVLFESYSVIGGTAMSLKSGHIDKSSYQSIANEIAAKWNLTSPDAPYLLEQQFYRVNDYNPSTDFLYFHHIPKTGGTTISDSLSFMLGSLVEDGQEAVLPGSHRSGQFDSNNNALKLLSTSNKTSPIYQYIASYSHTKLRPIHGPNRSKLSYFFEQYFALPNNKPKRLRSLAMLREPMDLRASTQAMAMCALNRKVIDFNSQRKREGLEPLCTPEQGLNISALWDVVVEKAMENCEGGKVDLDRYERLLCEEGPSRLDFCRSPSNLLSSQQYKTGMRSMLQGVMGRYFAQENMAMLDYYTGSKKAYEIGVNFSPAQVEQYTLIDLGGLDSNITHTPYEGYNTTMKRQLDSNTEPDFVWFGITERMQESTCLLSYTLNAKPLPKTPTARVMKCSPTGWWTEEHREIVKKLEPADYTVWRTANAILDVRVLKMQEDIRQKLENEADLSQEEKEQNRALVDAGCLE